MATTKVSSDREAMKKKAIELAKKKKGKLTYDDLNNLLPTDGGGVCEEIFGVVMKEAGVEGLGASVGRSDVGDNDVVVELRFEVAVGQVTIGSRPHTIGLLRAAAPADGNGMVFEIGHRSIGPGVEGRLNDATFIG